MKYIKLIPYAICVWVAALMMACSDTPEFPDPGLDLTRSAKDTVRRDTIDNYRLSLNINAPNGVAIMQVLDGHNYKTIKEFESEYAGKTNFTFDYDIDLTPYKNDTTLQYIVRVIDRSNRSYNKGFTLVVKGFSSPQIRVVGGQDVMGLVSPVFQLKARFSTGLNNIASYRVLLDGQAIDEVTVPSDDVIHDLDYVKTINTQMVKGKDCTLRLELTDNKGNEGHRQMTLRLTDLQRPYLVTYSQNGKLSRHLYLYYNEEKDRLDSIRQITYATAIGSDGYSTTIETPYLYEFSYNDKGIMTSWHSTNLKTGEASSNAVYSYDEQDRLTGIDTEEGNPTTAVTVTSWDEAGRPAAYLYGTSAKAVKDISYTTSSDNSIIFSEYWQSNRTNNYRQHCEGITPIPIPTYFPELPNIFQGSPNSVWQDLFLYRYVFEQTRYTYKSGTAQTSSVGYRTDSSGRIISMTRTTLGTSSNTVNQYVFSYAN